MQYEIRKVDEQRGVVCITTTDERWYEQDRKFYPSVSWITDHYPKGVGYYRWLANLGWNEAEAVKSMKGDKGSIVHKAIEMLLLGNEIKIDQIIDYKDQSREMTPEEYYCVMTFKQWFDEVKPKVIFTEQSFVNAELGFGGTIDFCCEINGERWLIDFKTSANVFRSHELQISAYRRFVDFPCKIGILQLGYTKNKHKHFKFTEVEDKYKLFEHAYAIWQEETTQKQPSQKDYPLTIKL